MRTGLRALVFVLAVPILVFVLAAGAQDRWDERWSRGLQREFRVHGLRASDRAMSRYSLGALCRDPRTAARTPPCRTYNRISGTMTAAAGTAGFGVLMLGAVWAAGAFGRRSRKALVLGFPPVVYATSAGVVVLLVAHGWLGVRVLSLSALLLGVSAPSATLTLAAGAVVLVGIVAADAVRLARRVGSPPKVFARALPAGPGTRLGDEIARLSGACGLAATPALVGGIAPAVFVSSSGIYAVDGRYRGPVLHLSLSLARILSLGELEAFAAAQLYRLRKDDGIRRARFWDGWARLQEEKARLAAAGGFRWLVGLPVRWLFAFLVDAYWEAARRLWREDEAASDRAAAGMAGAQDYCVALLKVGAFSGAWPATLRAMTSAAMDNEQYVNASLLFAETAADAARPERVRALLDNGALPLRPRIRSLGLDPDSLVDRALDLRPASPAIDLIEDATAVEEYLSTGRHLQLRRSES